MNKRAFRGMLCTTALVAALAGCGSDSEGDEAAACAAQSDLQSAVQELDATLTPDATIDQIRSARDQVATAVDELSDAAGDVAEDRADELRSAQDDLDDAVSDLDGDDTVPEALDSLRGEVDRVEQARDALASDLACD